MAASNSANIFSQTKRAASLSKDKKEEVKINEYIEEIEYHLNFMHEAGKISSQSLHFMGYMRISNETFMIDISRIEDITRFGDIVIREATTMFDISLLLTNLVAQTEINQRNLKFCNPKYKQNSLKDQIKEKGFENSTKLIDSILEIKNSIGYTSLNDYRNWITHRGAPKIIYPKSWAMPIEKTKELISITDPYLADQEMKKHILNLTCANIKIACHTFHSTAANMLMLSKTTTAAPVALMPKIENISYGSETLSVYPAGTYVKAIQDLSHFMLSSFRAWDKNLAKIILATRESI